MAGAYTDVNSLIALRHRASRLDLSSVSRSKNPLAGLLSSRFRGRGIDFAEVRAYQPGDDIRTIDWRVSARTGKTHTKLFQEEKELPVMIIADQSQAMFFGSRTAFKSVTCAETAASIAWASLNRGDRVGGVVFGNGEHREVKPRRSKHSVLRLLHDITDLNGSLSRDGTAVTGELATSIAQIRRVIKHGTTVYIVSDFHDFDNEARRHLRQLSQQNDVVGIHVSDPLEQMLPNPDLYTITNGSERVKINATARQYRTQYEQVFRDRLANLQDDFLRIKSLLVSISTVDDVVQTLEDSLSNDLVRARAGRDRAATAASKA